MPVLYDRDCGFCRFSMGVLLTWDRRRALRPVEIQSDEGGRLLAALPAAERLASAHAIDADGRPHSAGRAVVPVLRRLPAGGPLSALAGRIPTLTDRAYRAVAGHRSSLGRLVPAGAKRWADRVLAEREVRPPPAPGAATGA